MSRKHHSCICNETTCFAYDTRATGAYENRCSALKECYADSCPFYKSMKRRKKELKELEEREGLVYVRKLA